MSPAAYRVHGSCHSHVVSINSYFASVLDCQDSFLENTLRSIGTVDDAAGNAVGNTVGGIEKAAAVGTPLLSASENHTIPLSGNARTVRMEILINGLPRTGTEW